MKTIYDILAQAQALRNETKLDSVSPERLGAIHEETLKYINEYQLLASSPAISKVYSSVAGMQGDAAPKSDLTGRALTRGQLVVIVPASSSDATAGDVYRYDGPSGSTSKWTYVAKIGGVPADAELSETSTNPVQNKVVSKKFSELSEENKILLLSLFGTTSIRTPNNTAGWHYYPFVRVTRQTYTIEVDLASVASEPFYWVLQNGDNIIVERSITVGKTHDEVTIAIADNYEDVKLAIYCGGEHPSATITIDSAESTRKMADQVPQIKLRLNDLEINDVTYLSSSRFFYKDDNISETGSFPQVLNGQCAGVVNGVKISIDTPGTIVLLHAYGIDGNTPSFTDIKSYEVAKGINYLYFDSPVILGTGEAIGVSPSSTASYHRANYGQKDVGSKYFNGTKWTELTNGIVMATFVTDVSNSIKRISDVESMSEALSEDIKRVVVGDHYLTLLGSARFGQVTTDEKATAHVFLDGQDSLINRTIVGMKVSVSSSGTIVICRCENYLSASPIFTDLQSFDVRPGENYLLLNSPVILSAGEAIGVSPSSTASYHRGDYDSDYNKGYYYYTNRWMRSGADLVMAILGQELPQDLSKEFNDLKLDFTKVKSVSRSSAVYPTTPPLLYSHLFIDKIYIGSQPTIPTQSLFDVMIAASLGFKMLEINVMLTSDGVPITGHGVNGKLETLTDLNGIPVAVDVATTTYAQLRSNYRYRSIYPQFRVPITSLEECLLECQRYGITPFVQCVNQAVVNLVESIVGKRYVAYGAQRSQTDATICEYHKNITVDQLVDRCETVGYPYILGVDRDILDTLSDTEIKSLVARVHAKGCWVNWAGCYHTASGNLRIKRLGLDSCASGWEVPEFSEYEVRKKADSFKGWDDYSGTFGHTSDSASLANGQTMSAVIPQLGIIAKSQLVIHFKGKLLIKFGKVNASFESDGNVINFMTSVVENTDSSIEIISEGESVVYSIDYKTASVL